MQFIIIQFKTNIKATAPYYCFFVTPFMYVALLLRTGVCHAPMIPKVFIMLVFSFAIDTQCW